MTEQSAVPDRRRDPAYLFQLFMPGMTRDQVAGISADRLTENAAYRRKRSREAAGIAVDDREIARIISETSFVLCLNSLLSPARPRARSA